MKKLKQRIAFAKRRLGVLMAINAPPVVIKGEKELLKKLETELASYLN